VEGQLMVFLGTSIGVLSTTALSGPSTVWVQEAAATIGNVPVVWMDFRSSDNTLAVATHARGVFTTRFLGVGGIEPGAGSVRVALGPSYPNPTNGRCAAVPRHREIKDATARTICDQLEVARP